MSGRPPPPLPPSASAPLRTSSTALNRSVRSVVTPTTSPPLPSGAVLATATTPDPSLALPSSASDLSSVLARPLTIRRRNFVPLRSPMLDSVPAAPPPIASFFLVSPHLLSRSLPPSSLPPPHP